MPTRSDLTYADNGRHRHPQLKTYTFSIFFGSVSPLFASKCLRISDRAAAAVCGVGACETQSAAMPPYQ